MATHALDLATILKCFTELEVEHGIGKEGWLASNPSQEEVFSLLWKHARWVKLLHDLKCEVKINEPIPMSIKVTAVLDKQVHWKGGIAKKAEVKNSGISYPAFKLEHGCSVFSVEGQTEPLLVIDTQSGDKLWIMMSEKELDGLALTGKAFEIIDSMRRKHDEYVNSPDAVIPKIDFKLEPDIGFLSGARDGGAWSIAEARQKFKFRMNEEGARAKVETTMTLLGCCIRKVIKKEIIVIDRPFIGWFTQSYSLFPHGGFLCRCRLLERRRKTQGFLIAYRL